MVGDGDNLLPMDGELYCRRQFIQARRADELFENLLNGLAWQQEQLKICGKWILVPRLTAWYGDQTASYRYSGVEHSPIPWTSLLTELRSSVELACGHRFNSVLANWYRNERDSMGCHADNEKELGINPMIASLSFGETRLLRFRHKNKRLRLDLELAHGDLLLMAGSIQHHWRHELPKSKTAKSARINLTFRHIVRDE
ncbi:alpha-ketoglutarate-dependent dioxygenase AlkB [Methylomonas sp. HYX-M1]|uniref:alpha-ketoglutarate-dependent dioxygenase AlkB family protein n=1 Tax=Methylomonas sp. HYX-M1 TaxID=3139307 RepID=UPI00345B6B3D